VPSNQQRREAERLRLQRQVEQRREREVARRRSTLIISIVATLALLAAVISIIAVYAGGNSSPPAAGPPPSHAPHTPTASNPVTPKQEPTSTAPSIPAPSACATAKPGAKTVRFHGLTVRDATNLKHAPVISGHGKGTPKTLECLDVVTGKGTPATDSSTVTVQYTGVFYKTSKIFDSSWQRGQAATFPLGPGHVITGFTAGIGGAGKVTPMRVGSRRIIVLPAALAYGSTGTQGIPPNTPLVFVVDLHTVAS
jgi:peptidylprolyl isomerase